MFCESKYIPPEEYSLDLGDSGPRLERDKRKKIVVSHGTMPCAGPMCGVGMEGREAGRGKQRGVRGQDRGGWEPIVIPKRLCRKCIDIY